MQLGKNAPSPESQALPHKSLLLLLYTGREVLGWDQRARGSCAGAERLAARRGVIAHRDVAAADQGFKAAE